MLRGRSCFATMTFVNLSKNAAWYCAVCWCCVCLVFIYQQSKYLCNHRTGWCPVLFIGELIVLGLELAVQEIRKVKHSRVAVVAWQLERTVTSGILNFFRTYRSLCHRMSSTVSTTMLYFSSFLVNR